VEGSGLKRGRTLDVREGHGGKGKREGRIAGAVKDVLWTAMC